MKVELYLTCEQLNIFNEPVKAEKWFSGDLMLDRKAPRRFEFDSEFKKDDFKHHAPYVYEGYLKGKDRYYYASLKLGKE